MKKLQDLCVSFGLLLFLNAGCNSSQKTGSVTKELADKLTDLLGFEGGEKVAGDVPPEHAADPAFPQVTGFTFPKELTAGVDQTGLFTAVSCDYAVMDDSKAGGMGCGTGATMPVGSKLNGVSPYGALDMIGNIGEWVEDDWHNNYGVTTPPRPDDGSAWVDTPRGAARVMRGGSWDDDVTVVLRVSVRGGSGLNPSDSIGIIGFRCAQ